MRIRTTYVNLINLYVNYFYFHIGDIFLYALKVISVERVIYM